ncbi:MAG: EexN family lipoprotein [Pseudomonadota bacterium]
MSVKNRILPVLLLTGVLLSLSGCDNKRTEAYYYTHPETLKTFLRQCQSEGGTPDTFNVPCSVAYNAAVQMTRLSQAFINNQTDFGQRILRSQIRVVNTEKQLAIAEKAQLPVAELKKQLAAEKQHVDNLRAIVGLFIQI